MTNTSCRRTRGAALATSLVVSMAQFLVAPAARAGDISWKHTHFAAAQAGTMYLRRGAAFFGNGEVATLEVRGATGVLLAGAQPFDVYLTFRFDDGATLNARMQGQMQRDDYGAYGSQSGRGEFTGGTGRFEGARGAFSMNGRGGLSPMTEGVMADVVAECSGDLTLGKP